MTNGKRNKRIEQPIAPRRKYGVRRPHRGLQVRSLIAPISGWIEQACDRPRQIQEGQVVSVGPDQREQRIYRSLLQPEAELDAEEPDVHH